MHATSRESLAAAVDRFDTYVDHTGAVDLGTVADELFAVVGLLDREPSLRRALADSTSDPDARVRLLDSVFGQRLDSRTIEQLRGLVSSAWSSPRDLTDAIEALGRQAALAAAERSGTLDEVEDELFRFGRIVTSNAELRELLTDGRVPVQARIDLVDRLVEGKVNVATGRLLEQAVRAPRGRTLDRTLDELVALAARRRERYVAYVRAATPLSDAQESRLMSVLSRIYHRAVSLRVELDPALLGGMVVRVLDEVIDASVLSRLERVRRRLAE